VLRRCYNITGYLCIALLSLALGCVHIPGSKPGKPPPEVPSVEKSKPVTQTPPIVIDPRRGDQEEKSVQKPRPTSKTIRSLAILLNEGNTRDQQIADALKQQLGKPTELFFLNAIESQQQQVIDRLQASSHRQVVAIGSTAANRAKRLRRKQVVFSQVFNYQADGLLDAGFSGVSMVPSTKVVMKQWKKLSPSLDRIAVITGPSNEQQIREMIKIADELKVSIEHYVVNNDKEMLYTVQQAVGSVQGFWMLPDNRVLSLRGMKDFMSYTTKHNKQVAVFNRKLLKFGGLFYVSVQPGYVAKQIINAVQSPNSTLLSLDKAQVEVNRRTVERLNLLSNVL
jgi:ABC-type uncharacterized transport system substrate-binding protein